MNLSTLGLNITGPGTLTLQIDWTPIDTPDETPVDPVAAVDSVVAAFITQSQGRIALLTDEGVFTDMPPDNKVRVVYVSKEDGPVIDQHITADGYQGSDAIRACYATIKEHVGDIDLTLAFDAFTGTSALWLVDDSDDRRKWSDLQRTADHIGNYADVVINQHDTSHSTTITGSQEIDIMLGLDDHGYSVDHSIHDAYTNNPIYIAHPATRHASSGSDRTHAIEESARVNQLGLVHGHATCAYPIGTDPDGSAGPHPNNSDVGNVNLGVLWAYSILNAMGLGGPNHPYLESATRSDDGMHIDVQVSLQNGGVLYSPNPNGLSGWGLFVNGVPTHDTSGTLTAVIHDAAAGIVRLSMTDGSFMPTASTLSIFRNFNGELNDPFDSVEEARIRDGELYETYAKDPTGKGVPVNGSLTAEGKWQLMWPTLSTVAQAQGTYSAPDATRTYELDRADTDFDGENKNRKANLAGDSTTFDGLSAGDECLFASLLLGASSPASAITNMRVFAGSPIPASENPNVNLAESVSGGAPRNIAVIAHTVLGTEGGVVTDCDSQQAFWQFYTWKLGQSVTTTGAIYEQINGNTITFEGVAAGSTIIVYAMGQDSEITWSDNMDPSSRSTTALADYVGLGPVVMSTAATTSDDGGVAEITASGAQYMVGVVLPPK